MPVIGCNSKAIQPFRELRFMDKTIYLRSGLLISRHPRQQRHKARRF